jgi:hypothetical protein
VVAVVIGYGAAFLGLALTTTEARTAEAEARPKPVCLSAAETRQQ